MFRLPVDWRFGFFLSAMLALAGCGGGDDGDAESEEKPAAEKPAAAKGMKQVDLAKLPKTGDALPPQDDGRVEPAPPQGWKAAPRDNKFVARFSRKTGELPRVDIAAEAFSEIEDVTEANVADFIAKLEKRPKKRTFIEGYKPIKIGDRVWSRHVRKVKVGGIDSQIQGLETVVGGRLYSVDLMVSGQTAEDLMAERDNGYAVAANLKFSPDVKRPPIALPPAEGDSANPTP